MASSVPVGWSASRTTSDTWMRRRPVDDGDRELRQRRPAPVAGSVAVHSTAFRPIRKVEPDAGAHVTGTLAPAVARTAVTSG